MDKKKEYGKVVIHKKTGPESHEYKQAESKQSLDYYYKNKGKRAKTTKGNETLVDVTDVSDTSERSKELSRQR